MADQEVLQFLASGRRALADAPAQFGRTLGPEDYWWLGICLAAAVLAGAQSRPHVAQRLGELTEAFGHQGPSPERVGQLQNELAILDCQGLTWPLFAREEGRWQRTEAALAPTFGPEEAYWLGLGHIAAALLVGAGRQAEVPALATVIGDLVTGGLQPGHPDAILQVYAGLSGAP